MQNDKEAQRARWREEWRQRYEHNREKYRALKRANYRKNIQSHKKYARLKHEKYKAWIYQFKSKPCMDCRQTFPPYVMDFDHRPGENKLGEIGYFIRAQVPLEIVRREIAKCDLICSNCHRIRTFERGYLRTAATPEEPVQIKLTDIAVRNLRPPETGHVTYVDEGLPGFALRISSGGTRTFVLMYGPTRQRVTIGRYPIITLSQARTEAKRILAERTLGQKRSPRRRWDDALTEFLEFKEGKRPRTHQSYKRLLERHFRFGPTYMADITADDIKKRLDKLKDTPAERFAAFGAIRALMRWARKRGFLELNPVDTLDAPPPNASRERVLTNEELGAVYKAAKAHPAPYGPIVALCCLTGQRRSEIGALEREWIEGDQVTLPGRVTKNRRDHTIPLTTMAQTIIATLPSKGYLFPAERIRSERTTTFNGWSKAKAAFDKKLTGVAPYTLHDLRRTADTGMNALGIQPHIVERILNHVSAISPMERTYNRHRYLEEMRAALTLWENHLETLASNA